MTGAEQLARAMRTQGHASAAKVLKAKMGYVTSYNPNTYTVRVRLEPESSANEERGLKAVETNWLPILRVYGGSGWGMITPPNADPSKPYGDQCLVLWPDDGHGVALIGFFNDKERPFTGPDPGEMWMVHDSGSYVKLLNDGSILLEGESGNRVFMNADGSVRIFGAADAEINIKSSAPAGIGSVGASVSGVVTKQDLDFVLNQINIMFGTKQDGSGTSGTILAVASTSVEVTD